MRLFAMIGVSLAMLLGALPGRADEFWRPAAPVAPAAAPAVAERPPVVLIGRPEMMSAAGMEPASSQTVGQETAPLPAVSSSFVNPFAYLARGQNPEVPPPPSPFGPPGAPTAAQAPAPGPGPATDAYNCGVANTSDKSTFWERFCDKTKNCFGEITGGFGDLFKPGRDRKLFQSDHEFDMFSSPVSNPFFFMDPRSLTEVRPIFIYQHTPESNPAFAGGSNEFLGLQGRVAITEHLSIIVSELGLIWMGPRSHPGFPEFESHDGIAEFHIGPQLTFYRNTATKTLIAGGLTFEIPIGPEKVYQGTGSLGFTPYLSFAQNFLRSDYGSINFMNTTGWSGGSERADFFFSSFHFDYNILNQNRFFPMIEMNWAAYTNSGTVTNVNFEGGDLFNFGATHVAGQNDLSLAVGGRVKINDFWHVGLAASFNLLGDGAQHIDAFRLTVDMIFRY